MSERIIWHTKPCSVSGHCLLIGPSTGSHEFSVQMPIETAEFIVRACNSHKKLLDTLRVIRSQAQNTTTNPRLLLGLIQESAHETIIEICQPLAEANKEN